jgi:hypothetical protein
MIGAGALVTAAGCGQTEPPQPIRHTGTVEYVDADVDLPHIRYSDDQVSLNDRCPVRKSKLNRKMPPLYINGRPLGFC